MNNKDLAIRLAQAAYERERNGLSMYDLLEGVLDLYIALEEHEEHTLRGQLDLLLDDHIGQIDNEELIEALRARVGDE